MVQDGSLENPGLQLPWRRVASPGTGTHWPPGQKMFKSTARPPLPSAYAWALLHLLDQLVLAT